MNKFSKIAIGSAVSGVLTLGLISTVLAAPLNSPELQPKNFQAQHEVMHEAIEQGYDAWVNTVTESGKGEEMLKVINKDNFSRFQEAHKLREQAHDLMTQAEAINTELGLPSRGHGFGPEGKGMSRHGHGMNKMSGR